MQSRELLRWHPIKALLIRKRFHSSSKGTAASLGESQDRRDTQVDAVAGEGGGLPLPFAARAVATTEFGWILRDHEKVGGDVRSWWKVVGVVLVVCAILFATAFAAVLVYDLTTGGISGR